MDAALTVAQADARLEELTALLAEIRSNMRPEFEDRFAQVRAAGQEMIMLSDAWFAMNPNAPPEMSINAVWVSDLERITIAVQQLHRDVLGIGPSPAPPSPLFWGIAAAVVLGVGFVFYKSAYGDLNGLEAAYRHPRFRKAMSRDESESLWSKIDSEISPFSKRYAEFSKKLQKAKDRAESGDCANAYALWEEARLTHEGFSDKKQSGRSLVIAAAAIRRNC